MSAFGEVFPEATVKGCLFHFSQAVQRNVAQNGLEKVYRQTPPFDGPQFVPVHRWVRWLIALSLSPVRFHRVVWNDCLTNPPLTGDALVDGNLRAFRDYFRNQWLTNREKARLWNHFDRTGPRTTNHAEGYHAGLQAAFNTRRRVPLGVFMGTMRPLHHEIRCRVRQLLAGSTPKARKAQYIQNDANIQLAKVSLRNWMENNLPDIPLEQFDQVTIANLQNRLLRYLDHIQHCIG